MATIQLILHNIRSTHNVGSIFRSAEGFGVTRIILSGYTPYPTYLGDTRLPHIAEKITKQIHKTALGAETMVPFIHLDQPDFTALRDDGYVILGLEQDRRSIMLDTYHPSDRVALVLGEEVEGISTELRSKCDTLLEIPMHGQKESFNVSVAAGIALYQLTL
jgi:tRNA G18 (ribose-2'-O)-methylase SpoU